MDVTTVRRGYKRARPSTRRSRLAVQRIPRGLRYNGENKITRVVSTSFRYTNLGFNVGAGTSEAINFVFDPTGVTIWISALVSVTVPLPNAAELAALYDQVRIDKVELTMAASQQASTGAFSSSILPARLIICNDDNNGQGSATLAEIKQQPNKVFYDGDGKAVKWTCYPKYQRIVYFTSLVSNYEPARGFVNSDAAIPHYGMRLGIDNLSFFGATNQGNIDLSWKFFLTLKNVK